MSQRHSHKALPWSRVNETGQYVFVKLSLREPERIRAVTLATVDLLAVTAFCYRDIDLSVSVVMFCCGVVPMTYEAF